MNPAEQTPQAHAAQPHAVEGTAAPRPEHIQGLSPDSRESSGVAGRDTHDSQNSSTQLLHPVSEGQPTRGRSQENEGPYADFERVRVPPPARSRDGHIRVSSRHRSTGLHLLPRDSGLDWIVPAEEKPEDAHRRTIGERLKPTIDNAIIERNKYAQKALWTGYALNVAIGLQVFLGALTTGLAAALTSGRQAQASTALLGGLSTMVASYMARARGSGEPELSITRVKDLEHFLRECRAFQIDHAHEYGTPENGLDFRLDDLRRRFEELLGNASGQRKLSPVGITPTQV